MWGAYNMDLGSLNYTRKLSQDEPIANIFPLQFALPCEWYSVPEECWPEVTKADEFVGQCSSSRVVATDALVYLPDGVSGLGRSEAS